MYVRYEMFMRSREGYFGAYFPSYTAARRALTTTTINY